MAGAEAVIAPLVETLPTAAEVTTDIAPVVELTQSNYAADQVDTIAGNVDNPGDGLDALLEANLDEAPKQQVNNDESDAAPLEVKDIASNPDQEAQVVTQIEKIADVPKAVQDKMAEWTTTHPKPDRATDPLAYEAWTSERAKALDGIENDVAVSNTMVDWDNDHPEPDEQKDPEAHAQWIKDREQYKTSLENNPTPKEETTEDIENDAKEEAEKIDKDLSKKEKLARWRQLLAAKAALTQQGADLKAMDPKPNDYVTLLGQNEAKLDSVNQEIAQLEVDLGIKQRKDIFKAVLLAIGALAFSAAQEVKKK